MKILVQKVISSKLIIDNNVKCEINSGILAFLGITHSDNEDNVNFLINKLINLRIFNDENGKMNLSAKDLKKDFLIIPNFTLYADSKKGFRPSYIDASHPDHSKPLFEYFVNKLKEESNLIVECGVFGADMKVHLINDGPVTLMLEK